MLDVPTTVRREPGNGKQSLPPGMVGRCAATTTWFERARTTVVSAVIVGAAIGFVESTGLMVVAQSSGVLAHGVAAWASSAALATAGAIPLAYLLFVVAAAIGRLRLVCRLWRDLADGGGPRAVAVWRIALVTVAAVIFAVICFHAAAWTYRKSLDRETRLFAAFIAAASTSIGCAVAFAAAAVDRQVAERIATARWTVKAVSGRGMIVVLLALGISTILAPHAALRLALPDAHPAVSLGICSLGVAAFIVGAARLGDHRWARIVAVGVLLAIVAGVGALKGSAHGRRTVVAHGLLSKTMFRALSSSPFSDRDGDGYAGPFLGGADCDDAREDLNPGAVDIAGNGLDENCSGGDADPAWVSERFKPRMATSRAERRYNVLMVSIDALRADHVGAWGYSRATTPALDRFAAGATRFSWAFTSSPKTLPAIASLLTGRHPSSLVWQGGNRLLMDESRAKGLAETLLHAGYDTAAITCCARFARAENELTGFTHLDAAAAEELDRLPGRANSALVVEKAIRWVDERAARTAPYFLWIHLFDPHAPHDLPEGAAEFGDGRMDQYDSEIAFADLNLGRLLAALSERGLASTTIVVVAADHGEEFDEHGHRFHSSGLFNHVARIPLMVRYPAASPDVVSTPVSIVDVMPTILDLVGVRGPAGMNGRSLAPAVLGRGDAPVRPVLMEISHRVGMDRDMVAVASGPWKVIWDREANAWSLFSLVSDPDDRNDLALAEPERLEALRRLLFETIDRELSTGPMPTVTR